MAIFGPKFDPCAPLYLKIEISEIFLRIYIQCATKLHTNKMHKMKHKRGVLGPTQKLAMFRPKFDLCEPPFLEIKTLKPYFASIYNVWQFCTEIECIKWKTKKEFRPHTQIISFRTFTAIFAIVSMLIFQYYNHYIGSFTVWKTFVT